MSGSQLTGFLCRGIEIDLILDSGSKSNLFQWWSRNYLGFYAMNRNWLSFGVGSELRLFFVRGSKSISVWCAGRKLLGVNLWIEIDFVFSVGIDIDLVLSAGRRWLVFCVGIDWLSFCAGGRNLVGVCKLAENESVLVWASNLTSFLCGWSELTWFQCRDRIWLGFGVGVGNDLVLVLGSE